MSPALSVTVEATAAVLLQMPVCTTSRSPSRNSRGQVSATLVATPRLLTCCTNAGAPATAAAGVTALDAGEGRPVPTALVAVTVKV